MESNSANQANGKAYLASVLWHVQVVFLSFTIFAALLGNVLVLLATYLDKRLHNANKYFVACLAVSDLLVAMFSVTIRLHQYLQKNHPMTIHFCRFWIWVDIVSEAASITTVTIITIDRHYKVSRPFRYKTNMTTHRARRIIAFIWIYAATLGVLGLFSYKENKGVHITTENKCQNENRTFYTIAALVGFFIPVAILVILCIMMYRVVQNHSSKRLPSEGSADDGELTRVHRKKAHSNCRSLITLTMIVATFIICWGPFFVLFLIYQYNQSLLVSMGDHRFEVLHGICFGVLPYANSFLNPVIYAFFDKTFNIAIRNLPSRLCRRSKKYRTTTTKLSQHFSM